TPKPKSLLNRSKFSEHFKETLKENHSVYKNKTGLAEWLRSINRCFLKENNNKKGSGTFWSGRTCL
ncbi:MAG: hypothetical protein ACK5M7_11930, partial [Draconibacterium sp.]